jgi:hypothetical protein
VKAQLARVFQLRAKFVELDDLPRRTDVVRFCRENVARVVGKRFQMNWSISSL